MEDRDIRGARSLGEVTEVERRNSDWTLLPLVAMETLLSFLDGPEVYALSQVHPKWRFLDQPRCYRVARVHMERENLSRLLGWAAVRGQHVEDLRVTVDDLMPGRCVVQPSDMHVAFPFRRNTLISRWDAPLNTFLEVWKHFRSLRHLSLAGSANVPLLLMERPFVEFLEYLAGRRPPVSLRLQFGQGNVFRCSAFSLVAKMSLMIILIASSAACPLIEDKGHAKERFVLSGFGTVELPVYRKGNLPPEEDIQAEEESEEEGRGEDSGSCHSQGDGVDQNGK